jgi:hypothetical protein
LRSRDASFALLVRKEARALAASPSTWLLLLVVGLLVGHAFTTAVTLYAEASGIGGGPSALAQGLTPLEGIVVPTFGAYDLVATFLLPVATIRLVVGEKQSGELDLTLQGPTRFSTVIAAKGAALGALWIVSGVAGAGALALWSAIGGHLFAPETSTVLVGHLLRGFLAMGIGAAAGALSASAASATIVALTITIGTWALDYVAAARGGVIAAIARYTPSAALRVFEHGELRVSTTLILGTLGLTGFVVAFVWLREGESIAVRTRRLAAYGIIATVLCAGLSRVRASWDASESRRNSFSRIDETFLRSIQAPLVVTVNLAAEDPRLADLQRGVLAKLERTMRDVRVEFVATSRSGLFERAGDHYGEVWYRLGSGADQRAEMSRSTTDAIVLETIYALAGETRPASANDASYSGYPLARRAPAAPWLFFLAWPAIVLSAWWWTRRPNVSRQPVANSSSAYAEIR